MGQELKQFLFRGFKWALGLCVLGLFFLFGLSSYVINETKAQIVNPLSLDGFNPDCVLVLGAGVWEGNIPSPILKDRLDKGIEISIRGIETTLLMSGDHGTTDYNEPQVMKDYAIEAGLKSSDIFMDYAGFSTYESLYRAKVIFGVKKLIIVSQKSHLYRALYIAKALGLEALGIAAEDISYGGDFLREIRETLARTKDMFKVMIKPMPSFLGENIPIDGDGNVTND